MDIGKHITELREAKGWSTNRLANVCGLSQSFLRSVEMGEKGISVESLRLLCEALGVSLHQFFSAGETEDDPLLTEIAKLSPRQKGALGTFLHTLREDG